MTWLPSFLNWPAALLAAGVAVPALLVLYFLKLRRREMAVSSTILWKRAIQDLQVNAPFQRLRRNLLLFLQLLLLALLLLALAKPVLNVTPGAGATTVILIDRSASMSAKNADGGTRLDEAKRRAKELVNSMGRGATAMVIAFDDSAETVQPFTTDAAALRQAIDSVRPTDRKSRLKLAYQLAEAQMQFDPEQLRPGGNVSMPDVKVYSDGRVLDGEELSIRAPVTLEKVGDDQAGNVAVVAMSAKRNYERPTQVQIFARLANYGPEPVSSVVEMSVDGANVGGQGGGGATRLGEVFLLPDRWSDEQRGKYEQAAGNRPAGDIVEFELDLTDSAVIRIEQTRKEGDALAADDAAQVVVPPPKQLSVLLVTDGNYFLEKAVRSQTQLEKPDVMSPLFYEENRPTTYDVYLFDRYKPKQLPPAGNMIHFGVVPDGLKLKAVRDAGGRSLLIEDVGVLDWKRDHPILKGISMSRLFVASALKLDVPLDSEVLVDGLKGPLIALHREGKSTHMMVAFDVLESTWPLSQTFPYFMYNTLQYMAVGSEMDVRQSLEPGAKPRIPRPNLMKGAEPIRRVNLIAPDGGSTALTVPETADFVLPALDRVGLYRTDPPIPQFEQVAVNLLDANESNILPADRAPGGKPEDVREGSGKVRRDLWRYLVMAGIGMLFVEWWVYTRRVHL